MSCELGAVDRKGTVQCQDDSFVKHCSHKECQGHGSCYDASVALTWCTGSSGPPLSARDIRAVFRVCCQC